MIRILLLGACLFMGGTASAQKLIARLENGYDEGKFHIDILNNGGTTPTLIKIDCVEHCKKPINYSHKIDGCFYSFGVYSDISDHVFTSWETATGYRAIVYIVNDQGVKVLLDKISRGYADYFFDYGGQETLVTYDGGPSNDPRRLYKQIWYLDEKSFRKGRSVRLY